MKPPSRVAIHARGLRKSFRSTPILHGVDLTVEYGTMLALLGPNGAGKTTTVRILSTLLPFDGGEATVGGYDVARQPHDVRRIMGITGQYATVDDVLTGYQNLVMIGKLYHLGRTAATQRAAHLLERFDLRDAANRPVRTYSGGMRRRLDLAASLIADPPVLFLDEPTTGLDPRSRHTMWTVIRQLVADGTAVLLTTQYLEEADQLADRVAVIDHGAIIADGTAVELKARVGTERAELTFDSPTHLDAATGVLSSRYIQVEQQPHRLITPISGPDDVRQLLDTLAHAQLPIADLQLSRPTLDDAFFALTGHDAATPTADDRQEGATAA